MQQKPNKINPLCEEGKTRWQNGAIFMHTVKEILYISENICYNGYIKRKYGYVPLKLWFFCR